MSKWWNLQFCPSEHGRGQIFQKVNAVKEWAGIRYCILDNMSYIVNMSCKEGLTEKQVDDAYYKCKNEEVISTE